MAATSAGKLLRFNFKNGTEKWLLWLCIEYKIHWMQYRCTDGIVACAGGPIKCRYYQGETTKRPPNGCSFEDSYRYNGEVFLATDQCNICLCQNGNVECVVKKECRTLQAQPRKLNLGVWIIFDLKIFSISVILSNVFHVYEWRN